MTLSIHRIFAILSKDYKDLSRNYSVSIVILFTPILAAFYGRMGADSIDSVYMIINMTFAMIATYIQSCLIAEEKEKNTLRGLMLSPASIGDIIIGKSLLTFAATLITLVLCFFFIGYDPNNYPIIIFALFISMLFYISLGTLIGLFTKSVMEASIYSLPTIGIFSMGSFVTLVSDKYPILKIAHYLPNVQLIQIATKVEANLPIGKMLTEFLVIFIWMIAVTFLTITIFKRKRLD